MPVCYADYINNSARDRAELSSVRRVPAWDASSATMD